MPVVTVELWKGPPRYAAARLLSSERLGVEGSTTCFPKPLSWLKHERISECVCVRQADAQEDVWWGRLWRERGPPASLQGELLVDGYGGGLYWCCLYPFWYFYWSTMWTKKFVPQFYLYVLKQTTAKYMNMHTWLMNVNKALRGNTQRNGDLKSS